MALNLCAGETTATKEKPNGEKAPFRTQYIPDITVLDHLIRWGISPFTTASVTCTEDELEQGLRQLRAPVPRPCDAAGYGRSIAGTD